MCSVRKKGKNICVHAFSSSPPNTGCITLYKQIILFVFLAAGKARKANRPPIPALLAPPPGGFCTTPNGERSGDRANPGGFATPDRANSEIDEARGRVTTMWSSKSFPALVRGGSSIVNSRDVHGSRVLDRRGCSSNNGVNNEVTPCPKSASGSGAAGQNTPNRPSRKRLFSSMPSPSHLRRSLSFAGSISAISSAASRVAIGVMTPVRRRKQRREDRNSTEDLRRGRTNGSGAGTGPDAGGRAARRGSRHSTLPTNVSEPYESPGQTGGVSPEDESPVEAGEKSGSSGVVSSEAAGLSSAVVAVHTARSRRREGGGAPLQRDTSWEFSIGKGDTGEGCGRTAGGNGGGDGGSSSTGRHFDGQDSSGRQRRRKSRGRRKGHVSAAVVGRKEESNRDKEPSVVVEWCWEGPSVGDESMGEAVGESLPAARVNRRNGKEDEAAGTRANRRGREFTQLCRWPAPCV